MKGKKRIFLLFLNLIVAAHFSFSGLFFKAEEAKAATYLIYTLEDLNNVRNDLSGYYLIMNDINASETASWNSGAGWEPIGTQSAPFTGILDGQNHTISGLTSNRLSQEYVGMFGYVSGSASISNLRLDALAVAGKNWTGGLVGKSGGTIDNVIVSGDLTSASGLTDGQYVGGIVGENANGTISQAESNVDINGGRDAIGGVVGYLNGGTAEKCRFEGTIIGASEADGIGGIAGWSNGTISECVASGSLTGVTYIGGIVGSHNQSGVIEFSFSDAEVNGVTEIGGIVGHNDGTIRDSYSKGNVSGTDYYIGGAVGYIELRSTIQRVYSASVVSGGGDVGGLIGFIELPDSGLITISDSFWDTQASGQASSAGGTGKTTAEMKSVRTYTDTNWSAGLDNPWDFVNNPYDDTANNNIWHIASDINNGYPFIVLLDTTSPTVSAGVDKTVNSEFTQSGTASDSGSGIASVVWTKQSGPGTISFGSANATTTTIAADTEGEYTIRLTATDIAGNSAYDEMTLIWDTTPPAISISSPNNNSSTTSSTITFSGTVADSGSGVSSVAITIGQVTYSVSSTFSQNVNLNVGLNNITITATDNAGNIASQTVVITRISSQTQTSNTSMPSSFSFSQNQTPNSFKNNPKVIIVLQNILKYFGYIPAYIKNTGFYGFWTKKAIYLYQKTKGIVKSWRSWGAGWFGPKTRRVLNEDIRTGIVPEYVINSALSQHQSSVKFSRDLYLGSSGYYVVKLQKRLVNEGFLNKSYITGYFGPITKRAVIRYQKAHKIDINKGGAGRVGPKTRAVLNQYVL